MGSGYCTYYSLIVRDVTYERRAQIVQRLNDLDQIPEGLCGDTIWGPEAVEWDTHEEDLRIISKEFPEALFELHGEGDAQGDVWNLYVKNGKSQRCRGEVVYPPYDESQLEQLRESKTKKQSSTQKGFEVTFMSSGIITIYAEDEEAAVREFVVMSSAPLWEELRLNGIEMSDIRPLD